MPSYIIIGDGPAGISAAEAIRADDPDATITVLSADPNPYYYRAALTNYLLGQLRDDELWGVPPDFYARHGIGRYYGQVVGVDPARNVVALDSGRQIPYDALLIATGAAPAQLAVPGAALPGVMTFRTLQDARRIADLLPDVRQAVVVGGGTLGLEWVEGLRHQGLAVTYILRERQFMPRLLDATASELVLRQVRGAGVTLILDDEIAGVQAAQGWVGQVVTRAGRQLPCQLVGAAIGVRPNIAFLAGSGVRTERGVLTDAQLRTNVPNIFAAGDVAQVREPRGQRHTPPIGLWQPARAQGRAAGRNMAASATGRGTPREYDPGAPYVATRLYALDCVAVGETQPAATAARAYPLSARTATTYRKLLLRDGRLVGALLIGDRSNARVFKRLIDGAVDVTPIGTHLLDAHFDLAAWTERQAAAQAPRRLSLSGAVPRPGATPGGIAPADLSSLAVNPAVATAPRIAPAIATRRPAQLTLAGRTYAVSGERPITLGRAPDCDIVLVNTSVSRRHAELLPGAAGYALRDLNSANGSWVGLTRSEPAVPQVVRDGDLLRLGEVSLTFTLAAESTTAGDAAGGDAASLVGPGGVIALTKPITSLGRAADSDVPLEDRRASRLHAQILHTGAGDFYLRDMGSVNGTLVNGARVFDAHLLRDGDALGIGATAFTFRRAAPEEQGRAPRPAAELTIVQGSGAGTRHPLRDGDTTLGRDPGNTIALADPLATRRHAAITIAGGEARVRDLGSSNGTWVNGARLAAPQRLGDGDTIDIGQTRFVFRRGATAGRHAAAPGASAETTRLPDRTIVSVGAPVPPPADPALTIVGGAQDGRRFPLAPGATVVLGRDGQNAIPLVDVRASRRHAELRVGSTGGALLRDLGSSNGTLVNGQRIAAPYLLHDGDLVVVGETTLRFTAH